MTVQEIDIKLFQDEKTLIWDIALDADGDLVRDDGFGTTIALSVIGERRATSGEVPTPENRRGWIGSILSDIAGFEPGSKGWLFKQARLLPTTAVGIKNFHQDALEWMIEDGLAKTIEITSTQNGSRIIEEISIDGDPFFFDVWNNTRV